MFIKALKKGKFLLDLYIFTVLNRICDRWVWVGVFHNPFLKGWPLTLINPKQSYNENECN